MDCFIHQSPGRMRVRVARLKDDFEAAGRLVEAFERMSGVELVLLRRFTGSIVVHYDEGRVLPSSLLRLLGRHGVLAGNIVGFPRPVPQRPVSPHAYSPAARAVASLQASPEAQRFVWAAGKFLLGLIIERAVDKKTRKILGAFL